MSVMSRWLVIILVIVGLLGFLRLIVLVCAKSSYADIDVSKQDQGLLLSHKGPPLEDVVLTINGSSKVTLGMVTAENRFLSMRELFPHVDSTDRMPSVESVTLVARREGKRLKMHFMYAVSKSR